MSQFTRVTDRQTDRQTEFSSLDRVCIPCSAVKMAYVKIRSIADLTLCLYGLNKEIEIMLDIFLKAAKSASN